MARQSSEVSSPMMRYVLRRAIEGLLALLLLAVVVFLAEHATGSPLRYFVAPDESGKDIAQQVHLLGLDKPLYVQFWIFLVNASHGNFGNSFIYNRPVIGMLLDALPATIALAVTALVLTIFIGVPLGVLAAIRRGSGLDKVAMTASILSMSIPQFWLGILLIVLFAADLRWLPAFGYGAPVDIILPALTLSLSILAGMVRLTRSSMLDVLDSEFVNFARMKGLNEWRVIWKHALRNALIPVVTFAGITLGQLLNGIIVVETVFAWPGLGHLTINAAVELDYPVLQGAVLLDGLFFLASAFVVDVTYAWIDPRRRYAR